MSNNSIETVCSFAELSPNVGVAALVNNHQIALFYLPDETPSLYAIDNWDPIGGANVLARGIVGDINDELVVASPLYKQHFSLRDGRCLEQPVSVRTWPVNVKDGKVQVEVSPNDIKLSA